MSATRFSNYKKSNAPAAVPKKVVKEVSKPFVVPHVLYPKIDQKSYYSILYEFIEDYEGALAFYSGQKDHGSVVKAITEYILLETSEPTIIEVQAGVVGGKRWEKLNTIPEKSNFYSELYHVRTSNSGSNSSYSVNITKYKDTLSPDIRFWNCSCPQSSEMNFVCKHTIAVKLFRDLRGQGVELPKHPLDDTPIIVAKKERIPREVEPELPSPPPEMEEEDEIPLVDSRDALVPVSQEVSITNNNNVSVEINQVNGRLEQLLEMMYKLGVHVENQAKDIEVLKKREELPHKFPRKDDEP